MDATPKAPTTALPPPPPLTSRFVRLILGFGVSVAVGLAPFLGKLKIPGFDALLTVFPEELHYSLIPLSSFLMGLVAAGVQFLHGERLRHSHLRLAFVLAFVSVCGGFVWFLTVYDEQVVRIEIPATGTGRTFIISSEGRQKDCTCPRSWSDERCIRETFNPDRITQCWDLRKSRKLLRGSYLLLTGGFGAVIGLLLLQQGVRQTEEQKPRQTIVEEKSRQENSKQAGEL